MAFHPAPAMPASPVIGAGARVMRLPDVIGAKRTVVPGQLRVRYRSHSNIIQTSPGFTRMSIEATASGNGDAKNLSENFEAASRETNKMFNKVGADSSTTLGSNRSPRKVCIFVEPSPFSHVSGMKNRFLRLIENLVELGDEVTVVTPDRNPPANWHGAKVIGVHGFKLPFYPGDTLLLSYATDKRVKQLFSDPERKPDLLHCSSPGALIWTACFLANKYEVPLVQSYHTHIPHYIPQYTWAGLVKPMWDCIRVWTSRADLTMVTSSILQNELRGESCPRLQVWQKGVDTVTFNPKFRTEEMHRRLCGGREGQKVIGCVGRLGAEKNLKALKTVLENCPEGTNLALIGDGPERQVLEKHFEGTNATFMGMMLGDDLAAAYASLDVFVMPSESETLGFVVMEAMASGVPVVAVKAGGLQDILTNTPEVGQLYPSTDYVTAGKLTSELLTDEKEWQRQRQSCRQAVEEWSWMASNTKLRNTQYRMAIRRFQRNKRIKIFLELVNARRRVSDVTRVVLRSQWFFSFASYVVCFGALFTARGVLLGTDFASLGAVTTSGFENALAGVRTVTSLCGPFAPAAMATVVAFSAIVPFVPLPPLLLLCGLMFGVTEGAFVGLLGALEAAAVAFTFARQLGYVKLTRVVADPNPNGWFGPKFGAPAKRLIKQTLGTAENVFVDEKPLGRLLKLSLYRLTPHVPFTVANYVLGISKKVSFKTFIGATIFGTVPWCVFYSLIGAVCGAVAGGGGANALASTAEAVKFVTTGGDLLIALSIGVVLSWQPVLTYKAAKKFGEEAKRKSLAA